MMLKAGESSFETGEKNTVTRQHKELFERGLTAGFEYGVSQSFERGCDESCLACNRALAMKAIT